MNVKQIFDEAFPLTSACTNLNSKTNRHKSLDDSISIVKCCNIKSKLFKTYKKYNNNVSETKYRRYAKNLKKVLKNEEIAYY